MPKRKSELDQERRHGYLVELQEAGVLEGEPESRATTNETGLAYVSVTTDAGRRILRSWQKEKRNNRE